MSDLLLMTSILLGASAAAVLFTRAPQFWSSVAYDAVTAMLPKVLRVFRKKPPRY
jgi:hypothetical protein